MRFRRRNDGNGINFVQQFAPIGEVFAGIFFGNCPCIFFIGIAHADEFAFAFVRQFRIISRVMLSE